MSINNTSKENDKNLFKSPVRLFALLYYYYIIISQSAPLCNDKTKQFA